MQYQSFYTILVSEIHSNYIPTSRLFLKRQIIKKVFVHTSLYQDEKEQIELVIKS